MISILFRNSWHHNGELETGEEFEVAKKYFPVFEYRSEVPKNSLVIGRDSVLPFFEELEKELALKNSRLINSYKQNICIADICNYYEDIKEFTPKTYTQWGDLNEGVWVVKGRTNSRKFRWNTHMFAQGRTALLKVISNLYTDQMIADQGIVVRDYVPLVKLGEGINGLPITKEWRCFCYKNKVLATGFYWASEDELSPGNLSKKGLDFLNKIASIVSRKTNFYVVDVAEKKNGEYMVVELNDGCMSGLSSVDPNELYINLAKELKNDKTSLS
jgi:hypothetical protein